MSQSELPPRATAWMDLDDEALEKALDSIFDGGGPRAETAGNNLVVAPDEDASSLLEFGATCRAALGLEDHSGSISEPAPTGMESEALRARRVAARVLARTTRGDRDSNVIDFVAEKLRRSPLLRLAAAVLVVQVTVVPLIAWHLATLPEPDGFLTGIEPPPEVFEQDLPRLREPIEEAETKHDEMLGLGSSLSALVAELTTGWQRSSHDASWDDSPVDMALMELAMVAADSRYLVVGAATNPGSSNDLLVRALTLEARLIAFENARRSDGLSTTIQGLAGALESPGQASPAVLGLAVKALDRAASMNLAVPEVSTEIVREERDWLTCLTEALRAEQPTAQSTEWLTAIESR